MFQTAAEMDGKKDMEFFKREYSKLKFDTPEPIMYDNHYHGRLKGIYIYGWKVLKEKMGYL